MFKLANVQTAASQIEAICKIGKKKSNNLKILFYTNTKTVK